MIKQNQVKGIVDSLKRHEKEPALARKINCLLDSMLTTTLYTPPPPSSLGQHALLNKRVESTDIEQWLYMYNVEANMLSLSTCKSYF